MIQLGGALKIGRFPAVLAGAFALAASVLGMSAAKHSNSKPYTAIYVFGDSYSDIGARYLDGNGPTAVAYLAQAMGLQITYPKDPHARGKSLDFAATAATTGEDKGTDEWCCRGILEQIKDFESMAHSGALSFKPETTLFFLEGGLNDTDIPTDATLGNVTRAIHTLQGLGARHFTLANLSTKIPDFAKVAVRLDPAYEQLVADLQKQGIDIQLNHWGSYLDEILEHPSRYGIVNTTSQCAGRALFKEDPTPCAKPDTYFYFHSGHPSAAVNKIVGDQLYQELFGTAPSKKAASASK